MLSADGFIGIIDNMRKIDQPEYWVLQGMYGRCRGSSKRRDYKYYGGRGIVVCDRWSGKTGFDNFIKDMGKRPTKKHTIDRINPDGNYEPSNCRWATMIEQNNHRRIRVDNTSGIAGVAWYKPYGKWVVRKNVDGKRKTLGYFTTLEEARQTLTNYGF